MELTLPITVYWDLPPNAPLDDRLLRCCHEILECRPLMLQLYDPSEALGEGVQEILERFRGTPVALSLTISHSSLPSIAGIQTALSGVKELLIAHNTLKSLREIPPLSETGLAFFVNRTNWQDLPEVVSFCRERGISRLVLPMQRLYNGEVPFLLNRSEQEILQNSLSAIGGVAGLRLTIHDPFLWRAFNPGIPFPQGGCQAANTMIAIASDWGVYPCPTLPERLGEIGRETLKEIITSPAKKELRLRILENPAACASCLEIAVCRGGCRGRSLVMHDSFDGIDDACR